MPIDIPGGSWVGMPIDIPGGSRIVVLGLAGDELVDFPRRGTLTPLGEADDGETEPDPRRIFRGTSLAKRPRRGAGCSGDVSEIVKLLSLAGSAMATFAESAMVATGSGAILPFVWV